MSSVEGLSQVPNVRSNDVILSLSSSWLRIWFKVCGNNADTVQVGLERPSVPTPCTGKLPDAITPPWTELGYPRLARLNPRGPVARAIRVRAVTPGRHRCYIRLPPFALRPASFRSLLVLACRAVASSSSAPFPSLLWGFAAFTTGYVPRCARWYASIVVALWAFAAFTTASSPATPARGLAA